MFEAQLEKSEVLKKVIESIKEIVNEVNFDCKSSGLYVQAMDTSHVALIALEMRAEGFEAYRCDRAASLGINVEAMTKILKCAGNSDKLIMQTSDAKDNLSFVFQSTSRISEFKLTLMDIDTERVKIPQMEYDCVVKLGSRTFQSICREIQTLGDIVTIKVSKEGISFSVNGDLGSGNIMLHPDETADKEEDSVVIEQNEEVEMKFALRYLNNFAKATPLSSTVTLSMSPDVPLVVEYAIGSMGHVRFYLAPKIEDDEEKEASGDEEDEDEDVNVKAEESDEE